MLAEMEMESLLDADIDSKHRCTIMQEKDLETLVTRTPKKNWMIHSYWSDDVHGDCGTLFNLFMSSVLLF